MKNQLQIAPRHRLTVILEALPRGAQAHIARRCRCSPKTVSNVLNGKQNQHTDLARNIIRCAEALIK
ncbi:MAG: hypothetical protein LBV26_06820 [Bacteroidales bacterium]|jgi:transcriptional regulator with XRE-family HTH domain|nr:hypothetical protein [Bacteroidales bacterium]